MMIDSADVQRCATAKVQGDMTTSVGAKPKSILKRYEKTFEARQSESAPSGNMLLNAEMIGLPDDVLQKIVDEIVSAVPTQAIYVFGSIARGEESSQSDVDIFVVTDDASVMPHVHGGNARCAIGDTIYKLVNGCDLICTDVEVFEQEKEKPGTLSCVVQRKGVEPYERRKRLAA